MNQGKEELTGLQASWFHIVSLDLDGFIQNIDQRSRE
jgi:hypothetical protein